MDKENLEQLVNQRLSTYQIADILDCGQTNVRYWMKKYGLQSKSRYGKTEESEFKKCARCHEIKSLESFYQKRDRQKNLVIVKVVPTSKQSNDREKRNN